MAINSNFTPGQRKPMSLTTNERKPMPLDTAERRPRSIESTDPYSHWNREWGDLSVLEKVFDVLDRGQYASANVVRGLIEGDNDIIGNAWDGLTGKEKGDFIDILRTNNVEWAPVLGTVLNIGLDPFTYIGGPVAWYKKAKNGVLAGSKFVSKTDDAAKVIGDIVKNNNIVDTLGRAFIPDWKIPDEVFKVTEGAKYAFKDEKRHAYEDIQKTLGNITREQARLMTKWKLSGTMPKGAKDRELLSTALDWFDEATQRALDYGFITPKAIEKHTENGMSTYLPNVLHGWLDEWMPGKKLVTKTAIPNFARSRKSKFDISDWDYLSQTFKKLSELDSVEEIKKKAGEFYLDSKVISKADGNIKVFDKEGLEHIRHYVDKVGGDVGKVKKHLHELAVNYAPVDEIDKIMANYKVNLAQARWQDNVLDFVLKSDESNEWRKVLDDSNFLSSDTGKIVTRKNELQRALDIIPKGEGDEFTKSLRATLKGSKGKFFDLMDLDETLARSIKDNKWLKNHVDIFELDNEVFEYLTRAEGRFYGKTPASSKIGRWFDKVQGSWKRMATIYRLPFHMRNVVSSEATMIQGGMNPVDIIKYSKMAMNIQRGGDNILKIGGIAKTADEWGRVWSSRGVKGWGWIDDLSPNELASEGYLTMIGKANNTDKSIKDVLKMPAKKMQQLGMVVEDNARMSMAMWATEKGMKNGLDVTKALDEGAYTSWKHFFQYDQITEFEEKVKRYIPFYTWMRKNIPLQIDNLINRPQYTKNAGQVFHGVAQLNPATKQERDLLPDYMKENMYFKAPEWVSKMVGQEGQDAFVNIGLPWQDLARIAKPMETLLSSLTPASIVFNMGLNVNDFPHPGTKIEKFKGELVPAPWPATMLPEPVWGLMGMQPIRDKKSGKTVMGMPTKMAQSLYDLIPPIREINKMFPATADVDDGDAPWARLKYMTGINFTPVDFAEQRKYRELDHQNKIRDVARRMDVLGRPLTSDELDDYFKN